MPAARRVFAARAGWLVPPEYEVLLQPRWKSLQEPSLIVAAVCDRRDFPANRCPSALIERRYRTFAQVSVGIIRTGLIRMDTDDRRHR